jgi:Trk K+ transport system NAD-binding subunit
MKHSRAYLRQIRAGWRDTLLLLRDFRLPLMLLLLLIIGGGLLYDELARRAGEPVATPVEAVYDVMTMIFFQTGGAFPRTWYLQIFFFVMPVLGLGILAQGLADFGVLLFNRRARSKEWQMAVASTMSNHIVLVGLGHLGFRVVSQLNQLNQDVVVIEQEPRDDLVANLRRFDVPILEGDATREAILDAAGIRRARTLVLCTQNDNLNMQISVKARSMNPNLRVVIRIFDDDFAHALENQFGFHAVSATGMAAPIFAAEAIGIDISQPITVDGQALILARLNVSPKSPLVNLTVSEIEQTYDVSVVLLGNAGERDFHPGGNRRLAANHTLAVLGAPERINRLVKENR